MANWNGSGFLAMGRQHFAMIKMYLQQEKPWLVVPLAIIIMKFFVENQQSAPNGDSFKTCMCVRCCIVFGTIVDFTRCILCNLHISFCIACKRACIFSKKPLSTWTAIIEGKNGFFNRFIIFNNFDAIISFSILYICR